jgi:hypothetical protein
VLSLDCLCRPAPRAFGIGVANNPDQRRCGARRRRKFVLEFADEQALNVKVEKALRK